MASPKPSREFWKRKTLQEMTQAEWESLCDGCGRCCLMKFKDARTGRMWGTDVACRLLDRKTCRCTRYETRHAEVKDCDPVTPALVAQGDLPETCAYRRVHEGRDLPDWHHLISGSRETVHEAGMSVRGLRYSEADLTPAQIDRRERSWPMTGRKNPLRPSS